MAIFYVGSYDKHKGIYVCDLDEQTGQLSLIRKVETADYASYIIKDEDYLYVSYKNSTKKENAGGMGSFKIDGNHLIELSHATSNGRSYTHLCLSPNKDYLYGANYHAGTTVVYKIENHIVSKKTDVIYHRGMGADIFGRQTMPHVHYVGITPEKKYLYSVDLGSDSIIMYHYDHGHLIEEPSASIHVIPGSGPRHMIFSQNGKYAYLLNEIANNIMVFDVGSNGCVLSQKISCLPYGFKEMSSAAAIRLSEDGQYLIVSNRGHNSLALFKVSQTTGKIGLISFYGVGKNPRDFNIFHDYVICASQDDDVLEVFKIGEDELIRLNIQLKIPSPVCVCG